MQRCTELRHVRELEQFGMRYSWFVADRHIALQQSPMIHMRESTILRGSQYALRRKPQKEPGMCECRNHVHLA
eukprot:217870-Amphidinium_carterae.2